jgi:hypothetical protein
MRPRAHRLGDRDAVDPVHEVVGVDEGDEPEDRAHGEDGAPERRTGEVVQKDQAGEDGGDELDGQAAQGSDPDDVLQQPHQAEHRRGEGDGQPMTRLKRRGDGKGAERAHGRGHAASPRDRRDVGRALRGDVEHLRPSQNGEHHRCDRAADGHGDESPHDHRRHVVGAPPISDARLIRRPR